ncbi:MAG: hypothetical protein OQK40_01150, partial [Gammaproteobacteria bacterium]|nr:hypothetical protein [Gammaproteobacteria bacterium]
MIENTITSKADLLSVLHRNHPLSDRHLGEILVEEEALNEEQLQHALARQQKQPGVHLGDILVELGYCGREQITAALSRKLGIPYVKLGEFEIPPQVLHLIPEDIALQHSVLPLAKHNNRLIIAMENPLNWEVMELLRFHTNHNIDAVITSSAEISKVLDKYYLQHSEDTLAQMNDEVEIVAEENQKQDLAVIQN